MRGLCVYINLSYFFQTFFISIITVIRKQFRKKIKESREKHYRMSGPSRESHVLAPIFFCSKERTGQFRVVLLYFDIPRVCHTCRARIYKRSRNQVREA